MSQQLSPKTEATLKHYSHEIGKRLGTEFAKMLARHGITRDHPIVDEVGPLCADTAIAITDVMRRGFIAAVADATEVVRDNVNVQDPADWWKNDEANQNNAI